MGEEKIKELYELGKIIDSEKSNGKKIVLCHGCFDLFHPGHLYHMKDAKSQGDILVVTITPDEFVEKGVDRPYFTQDVRLKFLSEISVIDYVALNKWPTAIETLKIIKPNIYAKGKEVLDNAKIDEIKSEKGTKSNLMLEKEVLESFGGRLHITDEPTWSSSSFINKISKSLPDESKQVIKELNQKYGTENITKIIETLKDIRVLVIGDAIIDEYVHCDQMGKSGKEGLVTHKFSNHEMHAGGVFAVANHLSGFSDNVTLVTCIGNNDLEAIEKELNKNINKNIFIQPESKTLIKRRYLHAYNKKKVFEVYNVEGLKISYETEQKILDFLKQNMNEFDLIVVPDFGHGMMSEELIKYLPHAGKFFAVNCQFNGGNMGYNFITKYNRADFISLNDYELRMPFQNKERDVKHSIEKLSNLLGAKKINITLGKNGIIYFESGSYHHTPAFTKDPVDTIGSGDAVLALTSLLAYKGIEPDLIPFFGNSIGSISTKILGNRRSIDAIELKKFISYLGK